MKISKFKLEKSKSEDGVWIDVGEGLRLRIAHIGNPHYTAYLQQIGRQHRVAIRRQNIDDEELLKVVRKAMSRHVLLDWENLQDEDGAEVPYSPEQALEYLTNLPEFFGMVNEIANDISMFRDEVEEDSSGN